ncbi:MAG TPA: YicC family protein [Bacteroidetes bacterium]|nr:YicC family protein [Bacteroidota bacterium]
MIKSMTGFGKQTVETQNDKFTIEIRTLNSKQFDLNTKIPARLREYEPGIRKLSGQRLLRGKVDLMINIEPKTAQSAPGLNHTLAGHFYREIKELANVLGIELSEQVLSVILRMPEVWSVPEEETDPEEWGLLAENINLAMDAVDRFRISEGETLQKDFRLRIEKIKKLLSEVGLFESERTQNIKQRIKSNLANLANEIQQDKNRLEQEMIFYMEKLDITEEKIRLKKHCDYFIETLNGEETPGKKLIFIGQEIGREINTLGSKANDANIQKLVVLMKDELEKIKEQLFNIL